MIYEVKSKTVFFKEVAEKFPVVEIFLLHEFRNIFHFHQAGTEFSGSRGGDFPIFQLVMSCSFVTATSHTNNITKMSRISNKSKSKPDFIELKRNVLT